MAKVCGHIHDAVGQDMQTCLKEQRAALPDLSDNSCFFCCRYQVTSIKTWISKLRLVAQPPQGGWAVLSTLSRCQSSDVPAVAERFGPLAVRFSQLTAGLPISQDDRDGPA